MRAVPLRTTRSPNLSAGLLRRVPRDPDAREEGHAPTASSGADSAGQSTPSLAAPNGNSITCLTHDRDRPGTPLRTPGRSQETLDGKPRHIQEGEQ